ncbi:MAG: hypothetical protein LBJ63_06865, partial [Prevotellaceae bacterium]|nr:hypothetical protein [Prevotellaceae bacterium]
YFRLYENKKGDDVPVASEDKFSFDNEGFYRFAIDTGEQIKEDDHPAETPFLPRLFYYCIYESKENADKNRNAIYSYPEEYGKSKKNDGYSVNLYSVKSSDNYVVKRVVAIAGEEAVQEAADKQSAKEIEKLKIPRNYFLQLKVAKETTANKSIGAAAVKIGEALEKEEKEKCYCGKEHIDLRGRERFTFEKQQGNKGCFLKSKEIAEKLKGPVLGRYERYQVALEENNELVLDAAKMVSGLKHLDELLEQGYAVVVGVDHTMNYIHSTEGRINEGTTDHFVVIVARYCEDDKLYYQFWDVGTAEGTKPEYRFELMSDNSLVCAKDHRGRKLTVTQIR